MRRQTHAFGCRCGALRGTVDAVSPSQGTHLVCYCADCQRYARLLGAGDILNARGGTAIFHTVPSRIRLDQGQANLACLRLSPRGAYRWYASCCNTPLANTGKARLRFAGTILAAYPQEDALAAIGPVRAVVNAQSATPGKPLRNRGQLRLAARVLMAHLAAGCRPGGRDTPFFDSQGRPVVAPKLAARGGAGRNS